MSCEHQWENLVFCYCCIHCQTIRGKDFTESELEDIKNDYEPDTFVKDHTDEEK